MVRTPAVRSGESSGEEPDGAAALVQDRTTEQVYVGRSQARLRRLPVEQLCVGSNPTGPTNITGAGAKALPESISRGGYYPAPVRVQCCRLFEGG
jgi:hypothetical protein